MQQDYHKQKKRIEIDKEIVLSHSYIMKRVDGIVEIYYTGIIYDVEHFKEIDSSLKTLYTDKKLLILNHASSQTSATAKARDYLASDSRAEFIKAGAIIIHSLAQKILVHFYLTVNKPKVITNYFSENKKDQAEQWLLSFNNDHHHF